MTIDLKAKLATEEEETPKGERTISCSFAEGDMADSDRRSGAVLSMTNQDIGRRPAIQKLPFSFLLLLLSKYAIDLPSLT